VQAELLVAIPCELGESPVWLDGNDELVWIDAAACVLHSLKPEEGTPTATRFPGLSPAGMVIETSRAGTLLLSSRDGLVLFERKSGTVTPFSHPAAAMPHLFYNDGKVDGLGRLWVGTADRRETDPRGIFYRFDGRQGMPVDAGFAVCNGPAISRDASRLYLSDSVGRRVLAYDVDGDGRLLGRHELVRFDKGEGMPDGLTVDRDDCVWVAHFGGGCVSRYAPDGALLDRVPLPVPNVTSLGFGGTDNRQLFITTAREGLDEAGREAAPLSGSVFVVRTDVAGIRNRAYRLDP
jgi:xylono-1,5-lactonase